MWSMTVVMPSNRIMDLASSEPNPPVMLLMLSADETVYNPYAMRRFLEQHRDTQGVAHNAYAVRVCVCVYVRVCGMCVCVCVCVCM